MRQIRSKSATKPHAMYVHYYFWDLTARGKDGHQAMGKRGASSCGVQRLRVYSSGFAIKMFTGFINAHPARI